MGKEVPVNKKFLWGDDEWYTPSVYTCREGLVIDFLRKVPADKVKTFLDKYHLWPDSNVIYFAPEMRQQIDADNPLSVDIKPMVNLNGKALKSAGGSGYCWNPIFPASNRSGIKGAMQHYCLDPGYGWTLYQCVRMSVVCGCSTLFKM